MKEEIYQLKPSWSRIIHRVHSLGVTKQTYKNGIAEVSEECVYPRQYPSKNEDSSSSLDGQQLWRMNHWKEGWAVVNEARQQASILFRSHTGDVFHRIDVIETSRWECFECLLKLFSKKKSKAGLMTTSISEPRVTGGDIRKIKRVVDLFAGRLGTGLSIQYTIPTSGGLITKKEKILNLASQGSLISFLAKRSKLVLDTSSVFHVDVCQQGKTRLGMLYDVKGVPNFIIDAA